MLNQDTDVIQQNLAKPPVHNVIIERVKNLHIVCDQVLGYHRLKTDRGEEIGYRGPRDRATRQWVYIGQKLDYQCLLYFQSLHRQYQLQACQYIGVVYNDDVSTLNSLYIVLNALRVAQPLSLRGKRIALQYGHMLCLLLQYYPYYRAPHRVGNTARKYTKIDSKLIRHYTINNGNTPYLSPVSSILAMRKQDLYNVAQLRFGEHNVLQVGYAKLYQAYPDGEFACQNIEGILALVRHVSSTNHNFYCFYIINNSSTVLWVCPLASYGEQSFKVHEEDCLVFDDPEYINILQLTDARDCDELFESLQYYLTSKPLAAYSVEDRHQAQNTFAILEMPVAPVIVDQQVINQVINQQKNNQLNDVIRSAYQKVMMSSADEPEIYLALVSLQQQAQQGIIMNSHKQQFVLKLLEIIQLSESSVVCQRALKLLQYFIEDDIQLVAKILHSDHSLFQNQKTNLLSTLVTIMTRKCVYLNLSGKTIMCNEDLAACVLHILYSLFNNSFTFQPGADVRRGTKSISKIYSLTVSMQRQVVLNADQLACKQLQQLVNALVGLYVYCRADNADQGNYMVTFSSPNSEEYNQMGIIFNQIRLRQLAKEGPQKDVQLLILSVLDRILVLGHQYEQHCKATPQQATLVYPTNSASEMVQFLQTIIGQFDVELAGYILAHQNNKIMQYYVDSNYCSNMAVIFGILGFLFKNALCDDQLFSNISQILLGSYNNNLMPQLIRYIYYISSSTMFFTDNFNISLFDNMDIDYFINNLQPFMVRFVNLTYHISLFLDRYLECRQLHTTEQYAAQVNNLQFLFQTINANMINKLIYSVCNFSHCIFSKQLSKESVLKIMVSQVSNFHQRLIQDRDLHVNSDFIKQQFYILDNLMKIIHSNAQQLLQAGYKQEDANVIYQFAVELLANNTALMVQIVQQVASTQNRAVKEEILNQFYDNNIVVILCQCLKLRFIQQSHQDVFAEESKLVIQQFQENIIILFKFLLLDKVKNQNQSFDNLNSDQQSEIINLICILPSLLDLQFQNINQTNIQIALEEIKLYDTLSKQYIKREIASKSEMDELIESTIVFCGQLLQYILKYIEQDQKLSDTLSQNNFFINTVRCFINQITDLLDDSLDPNLQEQIFELMHHNILLTNMFDIVCVMLQVLQQSDEKEIQLLTEQTLIAFQTFFNINNSLKNLSQFLFEDIFKNNGVKFQQFMKRSLSYLQYSEKRPNDFNNGISMLIGTVVSKLVTILNLDVFSKQSVLDLSRRYNINILQERLTSDNIYQLYILNDEEVFNIESAAMNTGRATKLSKYQDYQNDFDLIEICGHLIVNQEPYTRINGLHILFFALNRLWSRVTCLQTPYESQNDFMQLVRLFNGKMLESVFHLFDENMANGANVHSQEREESKASCCIVLKIISYVYEIQHDLLQKQDGFFTNMSRVIRSLDGNSGPTSKKDDYIYAYIFKMLHSIVVRDVQPASGEQGTPTQSLPLKDIVLSTIDHILCQKPGINPKLVYFIFALLEQVAQSGDYNLCLEIFLNKEHYLTNIICVGSVTIDTILAQQNSSTAVMIIRLLILAPIQIARNVLYNTILLVTSTDIPYSQQKQQSSDVLIDSQKLKSQLSQTFESNLQSDEYNIMQYINKYFLLQGDIQKYFTQTNIVKHFYSIIEIMNLIFKVEGNIITKYKERINTYVVQLVVDVLTFTFQNKYVPQQRKQYEHDSEIKVQCDSITRIINQAILNTCIQKSSDPGIVLYLLRIQNQLVQFIYQYIQYSSSWIEVEKTVINIDNLISSLFLGIQYAYNNQLNKYQDQAQKSAQDMTKQLIDSIQHIIVQVINSTEICKSQIIEQQFNNINQTINSLIEMLCQYNHNTAQQQENNISTIANHSNLRSAGKLQKQLIIQQMQTYFNFILHLSTTNVCKQDLAGNSQLVVSCGKILLLETQKVTLPIELMEMCAKILDNLVSESTVEILVIDQYNRGINGIPVVQLTLTYLQNVINKKIMQNQTIIECLINALRKCLSYKGGRLAQKQELLRGILPECYSLCKEMSVMPGVGRADEIANQIVEVIEKM